MSRVAVVTGGGRGIGAATATRLASDGFAVAVLDLTAAQCEETVADITAAGGTALAVGADVSNEDSVEAAFATINAELGPGAGTGGRFNSPDRGTAESFCRPGCLRRIGMIQRRVSLLDLPEFEIWRLKYQLRNSSGL
jgi:NAD(P)-dependent dehydrogenase (short-subunit alcohol dehydrogenase family)